jgi:hypothetical protein
MRGTLSNKSRAGKKRDNVPSGSTDKASFRQGASMRRALLFVALVSFPPAAWPQGNPLGPEFQINTYTTAGQYFADVAPDASGNFVVVWQSFFQDGSYAGIFGQRYANSGAPVGPEFQINTFITILQVRPSVAADSSGNFVVVWDSYVQDGSGVGVFGQRYASSGAALGPEFRVNTFTTGNQYRPDVASDASGNFVVAWQSANQDGSNFGIFGQRYASSGTPSGQEFRVNTYTTNNQGSPSVAADSAGNFVLVWGSTLQDGSGGGIFGQRYASSGAPLGPEFRVNTYTTNAQGFKDVAWATSGGFVVVWSSQSQDGSAYGVFGQRYASSGAPLGPEFRVNTYTTLNQVAPSVAADAAGNFVVVWHSETQDGSSTGVFGQRYDSSGTPLGPEFRVNTHTTSFQNSSSVAADVTGNFVVVWQSANQDGSNDWGIFGQRYSPIVPVELMHFGIE